MSRTSDELSRIQHRLLAADAVCQILLGRGGSAPTLGPLTAILDTGADGTIIPVELLHQIGAQKISQGKAHGLWGDSRNVDVHAVSINLGGLQISALRVLADAHSDEIILGRNVLNRLKITFDGPAATTEIAE